MARLSARLFLPPRCRFECERPSARPGTDIARGLCLAGVLLGSVTLAGPSPAENGPSPDRPYVLYMGANIEVQVKRDMYPVRDYVGEAFVVEAGDRQLAVPMTRGPVGIKVSPELKLSDRTAVVTGLKVGRAYTPPNDPHRRFSAAQSAGAAQSIVGNSAGQMASAMMGAQLAGQRGAALGGPAGPLGGGDASAQVGAFNDAVMAAGSDMNSSGQVAGELEAELARQQFDAALVTCEVTAPRPLERPYLVVIAHYRTREEPTTTRTRIFAQQLERVDANPQKVRILQGDFPLGYELVRSEVHLYEGGRELGTNVAEKSVWLTREEAHQYLVVEHVAGHKGETLPPSLALGIERSDLEEQLATAERRQTIHVKVNAEGLPLAVYRDPDLIRPGGDALERLVAVVRFKPALKRGKPVEGIATLTIADLVRTD